MDFFFRLSHQLCYIVKSSKRVTIKRWSIANPVRSIEFPLNHCLSASKKLSNQKSTRKPSVDIGVVFMGMSALCVCPSLRESTVFYSLSYHSHSECGFIEQS